MARGGARFPHQAGASYIERILKSLPLWGLTRTSQIPLCKVCLSMFTAICSAPAGSWEGSKPQSFGYPEASYVWGGSHHTLPGSFLSSVKSKCYICSIIFRDCNDSQREFANNFQSFYRFYKLQEGEIDDDMMRYGLRFGVELVQNDRSALGEFFYNCQGDFKLIPFKDIQPWANEEQIPVNTSDPKCLDLARTWLENCVTSHKICQRSAVEQAFHPTRLLDLGDTLDQASCRLQNCAIESPSGPYCTLSHCWGKGEFLNLTKATLPELERGISISSLSRTFQDAIHAIRRIGVRYLWIDALCIIQDSLEDWKYEAARMLEIYAKSYCTIAATDAVNGGGFFADRAVSMVEPCVIKGFKFTKESREAYVVAYDDCWSINLLNAPLHRRGWVLQERLLSPRTIHFGKEQLFWECRSHTACESYPQGIPKLLTNPRANTWRLFDPLLVENQLQTVPEVNKRLLTSASAYKIWSQTVESYMECKISNPRDKLVAIAGIARKVAEVTHEQYLAGLWENEGLALQLLWHVLSRRQAGNSPSRRSDAYRAPSWSWACLEATIVWNWPTTYRTALLSIDETIITSPSGDDMCEVSEAALTIRGRLFEAKVEIAHMKADGSYDEDGDYNLLVDYEEINDDGTMTPLVFAIAGPFIHLDIAMMPVSTRTVYCLPVCTEWGGKRGSSPLQIAGLLLVQSPESEGQYTRIGIFGLDKAEACHFCGLDIEQADKLDDILNSITPQTITIT